MIAALALALALAAPSNSRVIDRVVAAIATGDEARAHRTLITLSELQVEARIALISRGAVDAATAKLPNDTLAATLDHVIAEHLLVAEAEGLDAVAVEPAELGQALSAFRSKFTTLEDYRAFLTRCELLEVELARILRRNLQVGAYLESRARLLGAPTEAELRKEYEARREQLGAVSFEDARELLAVVLERERRSRLTAELVTDLRSRARVRILYELRPRPGSAK